MGMPSQYPNRLQSVVVIVTVVIVTVVIVTVIIVTVVIVMVVIVMVVIATVVIVTVVIYSSDSSDNGEKNNATSTTKKYATSC